MKNLLIVGLLLISYKSYCQNIELPDEFENVTLLSNLQDPSAIAFSPDGRLFISERISGDLRIAEYDSILMQWALLDQPFYTFNVPAEEHRSSGLRGITFDPNFDQNGFVYAFYMLDNPRHNRVVRIQADSVYQDTAYLDELLILDVPFNNSISSGSHNGGDLVFADDGKLMFTTGDGWNGGDNVQSLSTYTGKIFRMNTDGTIPTDNPFYNTANGNYRAIYALGLRNPYTVSCVSETGNIYINDAVGNAKATVYQLLSNGSSAEANFGHDGYNGIGILTDPWTNTGVGGAKLITGGAWYPQNGYWPEEYRGGYYAAMWGSNSVSAGNIVRVESEVNPISTIFASGILVPPRHKPVMTEIGPDGNLYYLLTDYETGDGQVHMIKFSGEPVVVSPKFVPSPNQYDDPINVGISSETTEATIYYTLDGSTPTDSSLLYTDSILVTDDLIIKAIAFADSLLPSSVSIGEYMIGPVPNLNPIADAGPNLIVRVGEVATLNGSGSYDPDGSPLEIMESWTQIDGPATVLLDDDETVANFTPMLTGTYTFKIKVQDVDGAIDSASTRITAVDYIPDVLDGLIARYSFEAGSGILIEDTSPNSNRGDLAGGDWSTDVGDNSDYSIFFNGMDDRVNIENIDITGNAMTICFWTKIQSFSTHDARFISKADGQYDSDHKWMISTLNGDKLRFRLNTDAGGTKTLISDPGVLPLNEWMHIAAVYDGSEMILYKNGVIVTSTAQTGNIGSDPNMEAAIGNQPPNATGGDRPFDGWIDELRIYGRALTVVEVDSVMQAPVEKCSQMVTSHLDNGNSTFRRAIACSISFDSVFFDANIADTILLTSAPIDINSSVTIEGLDTFKPTITNCLQEPGIAVASSIQVTMKNMDFNSKYGPFLYNAGILSILDVHMKGPENSILPLVQNAGHATILGAFLLSTND